MAKRKRMTQRQKQIRADTKKELQARGILPPDKKRLNRKAFVEEAMEEWNGKSRDFYAWDLFLYQAIAYMLCQIDKHGKVSPEAIGVAKCLKLAIRLKEFSDKLKEQGKIKYQVMDQYEYIKDILDA